MTACFTLPSEGPSVSRLTRPTHPRAGPGPRPGSLESHGQSPPRPATVLVGGRWGALF